MNDDVHEEVHNHNDDGECSNHDQRFAPLLRVLIDHANFIFLKRQLVATMSESATRKFVKPSGQTGGIREVGDEEGHGAGGE